MTTRSATAAIAALLAGCGTDSQGETVVENAGQASVIGASAAGVYWTVPGSGGTRVLGAALGTFPAEPQELAIATGPVVHASDHAVLAAPDVLLRARIDGPLARGAATAADALGEIQGPTPRLVWTLADKLSWGENEAERTVTLARTTRVDHVHATARRIYAAVDGTTERRLVYVDLADGLVQNLTSSTGFAAEFSNPADGATYKGRVVSADDDGAYWLVEELPSRRALLVALPERGAPAVVLDTIQKASGFFVTTDAFYWQEGSTLLTAPRAGGSASIAAELDGTAGALAEGFVYYVTADGAIERLAL